MQRVREEMGDKSKLQEPEVDLSEGGLTEEELMLLHDKDSQIRQELDNFLEKGELGNKFWPEADLRRTLGYETSNP